MRVVKLFHVIDWKSAIAELVLIVLGISIALGVDSWWENRQVYGEEVSLLNQILTTLQEDRQSLQETLGGVTDRAERLTVLENHLIDKLPYDDSLMDNFLALRVWQTSHVRKAPYESLKARGLDIVSNRELRLLLINYYDSEVPRLEGRDKTDRDLTLAYSSSVLQKHILWVGDSYTPVDYELMLKDPEFRYMLTHKAILIRLGTSPSYEQMIERTDQLIAALREELIL